MADPTHLGILLLSGTFERVHYALCVASTAAALERPVTLFVTQGALLALTGDDGSGRPGWAALPAGAVVADTDVADGGALDAQNRARGVAGFDELLEACAALGVEFMVCEMGLRALGLEPGRLRSDIAIHRGGLATLLGRGGQTVTL